MTLRETVRKGIYKWLPIVFGCHCRADRSFFYRGRQFPVCARCTGLLFGFLLGVAMLFLYTPPVWVLVILALPMIADGLIQRFTAYESGNIRRLATGLLFGCAIVCLFSLSVHTVFLLGREVGDTVRLK